ncbi:MAG: bifunctional 5,10-methylenetetrahydrofolate dehydrogenase/5,10-methenyltetrahydrofolate cyclohydrolase [Candidatus Omnitrophica bacterium]|nr:bifunctional 5,10-methylenetetrahydrofolate dehydrogenase/5,10-methenyltetrahydrofolate cyclohydrolase [Candidatus Omnitrophota bacterium]
MPSQAQILNGRTLAAKYVLEAKREILRLREPLTLATVRVGESQDAVLYAKALHRLLNELSIKHADRVYPRTIPEKALIREIQKLNRNSRVTGILVYSPLPAPIRPAVILNSIDILKDVEGRRVINGGTSRIVSPTANAVLRLIEAAARSVEGRDAVIVGHSDLVGKQAAILLLDRHATVTICHAKTKDVKARVEKADIVVAAAGRPHLIKGRWIKKGAVVIDVGENIVGGKLVGDVEFETAKARASFISPVPGGVGPLTNIMLIKNLIRLHGLQTEKNGNP